MRQSEDQPGENRSRKRVEGFGELPILLVLLAVFSVVLISFATVQVAAAASPQKPPMILPADAGTSSLGQAAAGTSWIVGGTPGPATDRIARSEGATAVDRRLGSYRISRDRARALADRLAAAGRLAYAEPDLPLEQAGYPADLLSTEQWWLYRIVSPGDVTPPVVGAASPTVALIEESLDVSHPDLSNANLTGAKSLGPAADTHGTSVAGILGSPGEMLGIRGVWPGAKMQLFASGLKCSTASKAVAKAADSGAAVINMSYTFPADLCFTHFMATQYAVKQGSLPVAAAGNTGESGNAPVRPASDPHVLSVGAVDSESVVAPFSTRNAGVDITAPGAKVLAPVVRAGTSSNGNASVVYEWDQVDGTSFSAPMVSAAAAWLKQVRPGLSNLQISKLLTDSAIDLGDPGRDPEYGAGLLSIERSLTAAAPVSDPLEPNDDIRWLNGSLLKKKAPFLWRAGFGKTKVVTATLSRAKDPADVYRVLIPARSRINFNVSQLEGDIVLSALKPAAKSIYRPGRNLIVRSNRPAPKTEGIVVRNLKKKPQAIWLSITPSPTQQGDESKYRLRIVRR